MTEPNWNDPEVWRTLAIRPELTAGDLVHVHNSDSAEHVNGTISARTDIRAIVDIGDGEIHQFHMARVYPHADRGACFQCARRAIALDFANA